MGPSRAVWTAVALAVTAMVVAAPYLSPFDDPPPEVVVGHASVGLVFLLLGLTTWRLQRENRLGRLMVAAGVAWFIPNLGWIPWSPLHSLAVVETALFHAVVFHLIGAFPFGRLQNWPERVLVAANYGYNLLFAAVQVLSQPSAPQCPGCSSGPVFVVVERPNRLLERLDVPVTALLIGLVVVCLVRRWRNADRFGRRVLVSVFWAAAPLAMVVMARSLGGVVATPAWFDRVLYVAYVLAIAVLPVLMLASLLRGRLARWGMGELVLELSRPLERGQLQAAIVRALADPTVQLAYRGSSSHAWVDPYGNCVELPDSGDLRRVTYLCDDPSFTVALIHDVPPPQNLALFDSVLAAARMAVRNERLQTEVQGQLEEVSQSRARIMAAADDARRCLERDIHDGAQQRLLVAAMVLRQAAGAAAGIDSALLLGRASAELDAAMRELRDLARGVYPAVLGSLGLVAAVESIVDRLPMAAVVTGDLRRRLPGPVEATAYFVVSEALTNVVKYACASSVEIRIVEGPSAVQVTVTDDGVGGADPAGGSGLNGLADRVAVAGGTLEISSPSGAGTSVRMELPCP